MKYTEFEEETKKLSSSYDFSVDKEIGEYTVYVLYKGETILIIYSNQFALDPVGYPDEFEKLPFSHKLWMLASELAITPYDERFEHKYNVIVGHDRSIHYPYVVWCKAHCSYNFEIDCIKKCSLNSENVADRFQFTDSEFKDLIKYIKTLPDGEFQAKVAEHGKRLVEDK